LKSFNYHVPTEVVFGLDAEEKLVGMLQKYGRKNIMILCPKFIAGSELLANIEAMLKEAGIRYNVQKGIAPNPTMSVVREKIAIAKEEGNDFVLAIGGGSSIDTAKAVALGLANPDVDILDFYTGKQSPAKSVGCGSILTIAASGSETSWSCVITDDTNSGLKLGTRGACMRPIFALLNPKNTYTLPRFQLTCGIADILMHTLDRYFSSVDGNEVTDQIAEGIMRTVLKAAPAALADQTNYDAMSEIMWCGSLSHNGITNLGRPMDFSVHGLGNVFSGNFNATHGAVMAMLWPHWARYVYKKDIARFARLGRQVLGIAEADDEKAALAAIAKLEDFFRSLGLPDKFSGLNMKAVTNEELRVVAEQITKNDSKKIGNFYPLGLEDVYSIYAAANQ